MIVPRTSVGGFASWWVCFYLFLFCFGFLLQLKPLFELSNVGIHFQTLDGAKGPHITKNRLKKQKYLI